MDDGIDGFSTDTSSDAGLLDRLVATLRADFSAAEQRAARIKASRMRALPDARGRRPTERAAFMTASATQLARALRLALGQG